jgi:hypothetical protein
MAQVGQLKILADKTEELALLSQYLTNPKLIAQLSDEVKRLNALTADEEQKAKDARELISKHAEILAGLKAENAKHEANIAEIAGRESDLSKAKEAHALQVAEKEATHKADAEALAQEKKTFLEQIEKENERIANTQKGFSLQVEKFKSEKDELAREKENLTKLQEAATALKTKYEKKIALIQSDTE